MKLVCRNLLLRGPLAKQSRGRRSRPAATAITANLAAGNLKVAERGVHLTHGVVRRHLGGTAPAGTGDVLA
jgi:hypothetical protein